jgi:TM2 domain-containing membrane protein YozV
MFCSKCGNKLLSESTFCPSCGNNIRMNQTLSNNKSMIAAALLALFFGGFGIHNFYLGYKEKGTTQLLLSTIGWIILIGPFIAGIWAFIEAIMLLTGAIRVDAEGNPLI